MNRNLVGSTYGRFCVKFPQSRMKGERHRLSPQSLVEAFLSQEVRNVNILGQILQPCRHTNDIVVHIIFNYCNYFGLFNFCINLISYSLVVCVVLVCVVAIAWFMVWDGFTFKLEGFEKKIMMDLQLGMINIILVGFKLQHSLEPYEWANGIMIPKFCKYQVNSPAFFVFFNLKYTGI